MRSLILLNLAAILLGIIAIGIFATNVPSTITTDRTTQIEQAINAN